MHSSGEGPFLVVTPAGAYFSVAAPDEDPARQVLRHLMASGRSLRREDLPAGGEGAEVQRLLTLGWVQARPEPDSCPEASLEALLPVLLPDLSELGRSLLADHQGLAIGHSGFDEAEVQGLAGLSADAVALHRRAAPLLPDRGPRLPRAWAMVDAAGNSRIGFWPLYLPGRQFVLVLEGRPLFIRTAFQQLVWILVRRYGAPASHS
jgi:hypothetical protein